MCVVLGMLGVVTELTLQVRLEIDNYIIPQCRVWLKYRAFKMLGVVTELAAGARSLQLTTHTIQTHTQAVPIAQLVERTFTTGAQR